MFTHARGNRSKSKNCELETPIAAMSHTLRGITVGAFIYSNNSFRATFLLVKDIVTDGLVLSTLFPSREPSNGAQLLQGRVILLHSVYKHIVNTTVLAAILHVVIAGMISDFSCNCATTLYDGWIGRGWDKPLCTRHIFTYLFPEKCQARSGEQWTPPLSLSHLLDVQPALQQSR